MFTQLPTDAETCQRLKQSADAIGISPSEFRELESGLRRANPAEYKLLAEAQRKREIAKQKAEESERQYLQSIGIVAEHENLKKAITAIERQITTLGYRTGEWQAKLANVSNVLAREIGSDRAVWGETTVELDPWNLLQMQIQESALQTLLAGVPEFLKAKEHELATARKALADFEAKHLVAGARN